MTPNDDAEHIEPAHDSATEQIPTEATEPTDVSDRVTTGPLKRSRISAIWVAVIVAIVILVFLLIFILQNLASATVYYLGAAGTLPLGVALLFAAVGGALLVALVGAARILQLRRHATKRVTAPHEAAAPQRR